MKALNIFIIGAMTAYSSAIAGSSITNGMAFTNNLVRVSVTEVCTSTNSSGGLRNQIFGNRHLIADCAADMGITNLTGLSLVYNRSNSSLDVVTGTNQTFLCTALSFEGGVFVTNVNNTTIEGLSFVFVGTNTTSSGTISTTEMVRYGSTNQITSWSLIGRFQYALPASGTNGAVICRGVLTSRSPIIQHRDRDRHDDDEDNDHDDDDD